MNKLIIDSISAQNIGKSAKRQDGAIWGNYIVRVNSVGAYAVYDIYDINDSFKKIYALVSIDESKPTPYSENTA